ncbi:54S ribosomal protein subunit img1, mitochondrial, partial [Teratosphaeria destructans]
AETGLETHPPSCPRPGSTLKVCPDPIAVLTAAQLRVLDPTGARTRLFSPDNPERVKPGDILLVRHKSGDPWSGVVLNIRRRHSPIDTAVLLRGQLTRVGVEMWVKIYSPNVEGIEVVQRKVGRRARRAKLHYMRLPRHDIGSVEGVVKAYVRQKAGGPVAGSRVKGRDAGSQSKKSNKKGRN